MRPARPLAALVLLAVAAWLAGCSGGPSPRAWAVAVCTSLDPWRTEIGSLTTRTQEQMAAATTPEQAKENLIRLFDGAEQASERARAGVEKAGVPDVPGGDRIAGSFTTALAAVRDSYARARSGIEGLAIAPANLFYQQVGKVVETLDAEYSAGSLDTSNLNSPPLKKAFDEVPECR
jgi:hypothetical protein